MAEALSANTSLNEELEDLALDEFKIIKTFKGKDDMIYILSCSLSLKNLHN